MKTENINDWTARQKLRLIINIKWSTVLSLSILEFRKY